MNIKVMSRSEVKRFTHSHIGLNNDKLKDQYFIISISDQYQNSPKFDVDPDCLGICYLHFDDVEKGEQNCITETDVYYLELFLSRAFNKYPHVENIIVHCGAGVSRSAGMAAALMKFYNNDDTSIFDNSKYCPNMTVYRMVLNKLMGDINEEEIKSKEEKNIMLWRKINGLDEDD